MAWDQGPYPVLDDFVQEIGLNDAPRVIREQEIDCIYVSSLGSKKRRIGRVA